HPVARNLDPELDRPGVGAARDHHVRPLTVAAGVQPLNDPSVLPERRFAQRRPEQLDPATFPLVGECRSQAEPVGRPERAEPFTELGGPIVELSCFLPGDAIDGAGDEQLVDGAAVRTDGFEQVLRDLREAGAGVLAVPNQPIENVIARISSMSPPAARMTPSYEP